MIELSQSPRETAFNNPLARTVGFELEGHTLTRKIAQTPIWGTDITPRMVTTDQLAIPRELVLPGTTTTGAEMHMHHEAMRALAHKVQTHQASFKPVICFFDGRNLFAASGFNSIQATRTVEPYLLIPVIVFEGSREDSIQYAVSTGAATLKPQE